MWLNTRKQSSTYLLYRTGRNSDRQLDRQFPSWKHIKMLANVGPRGKPIPTPSSCLYSFFLSKRKYEFVREISSIERNNFRGIPFMPLQWLNRESRAVLMVSTTGMLVNKLSTSKPRNIANFQKL